MEIIRAAFDRGSDSPAPAANANPAVTSGGVHRMPLHPSRSRAKLSAAAPSALTVWQALLN